MRMMIRVIIVGNKKQMHLSYSEDILQRIRAQQSMNNTMRNFMTPNNPESFKSTMYRSKHYSDKNSPSRIHQAALSPLLKKPIVYNECINEDECRVRGRYRLRNYRQPKLKVVEPNKAEDSKWLMTSYNGLKEMMKVQIDKSSFVKRSYDNIIEKGDHEVVQKLKSQLLFLPNSVKIPHRNRYRPNKRHFSNPSNKIVINGNKLQDKLKGNKQRQQMEAQLQNFPDNNKRTAGYELKYRRNYEQKKVLKNEIKEIQKQYDILQHDPLTGWS